MSDARKFLVDAVRNAPDDVILDLVVSALEAAPSSGASRAARAATRIGTVAERRRRAGGAVRGVGSLGSGRLVFLSDVAVQLHVGGSVTTIKTGTATRLLWYLAKARVDDEDAGVDAAEAGWRKGDEVDEALGITREHLNVLAYRARNALARAGIDGIIERHQATTSMRIGLPASRMDGLD